MPTTVCQNICDLLMKSSLEICDESIQLLESRILENPADNEAKLQLSVGYFWLYHLIFEKLHKVAEEEVNSAMKPAAREVTVNKNDDDDIEENDFCDIKPAFPYLTLPVENEMVKSLERAFQLWTEVSDDSKCNWMDFIEIIHHWKILDIIHATAEIYATNAHDLNELNAWILLCEISSTVGDKERRFIACLSLLNFFIRLGYLDLSAHFLNDIESNIYCSEELEVLKFKFQLVKSRYNLHTGKFDEGLQLLQSVLSTSSEKGSKSWKIIQIEALILQSQYLSLPRSAFTDSKNFEFIQRKTAIAIAMEAVTRSISLLKLIAAKQFPETYPHDWMCFKPSLLRNLLESCFYLGELCFQAGEPRFARCYLQEGLKAAEAHVLTCWSSKMLLLLGQVDLFCDNPEDCMVKLNGLKYIMSENSNISISTLLSKVHEETEDITHSSFEELNIHSKDGISLLWDFKRRFIKNSDVHSSPVSSKKLKSGRSVNQVSSSAHSRFSINLVQTEIAFISSLYFIAQGETTGIESELKAILRDCDNLKKLTLISNKILSAKLCDSVNELSRNPSKPEVMLSTFTALKLSLIHFSNGSSDEAENYINLACASLNSSSKFYKYLYPNIYALIKYQEIIATLKRMMKIKPNFSLEYQICPSIKSCYQMSNARKLKKTSFNCSTPCNKTVPRSTGAHNSSRHEKCRAPIKRETLPSHIKKDLTSKPSFQFSIKDSPVLNLSNSEDELVFESPKKDAVFQTKSKSTRKCSSRQEKVKKTSGDEYKFFKSRNFNLQVTSASDIWNLALLDTPKMEKKPLKLRASKTGPVKSIKHRRKTGAVKSESNLPQKTSNISSDVSSKPSKSGSNSKLPPDVIYEDNDSGKASCDFKSHDFLRPRIFIESSRSSPRDPSIPEVNLTDNSEHDLLFPPNETFSSSGSRTEDPLLHTVNELCEDVTALVISESINDSKDLAIPEMKLKEFIAELKDIKQLLHHSLSYPIYADLCRLLAILLMNQLSDKMCYNETLLSVGFLLSETCSVTLRNSHITNLLSFKVWEESEEKKSVLNSLKAVDLPIDVQMQNILNTIPKDWTVLQISALTAKENGSALNENSTPTKLIVCRYQHNSIPLVSCIDSSL
ncbi:uncharacterized protein LOC118204682, partial [Stegodyphus dumicola]|uniref:uncharacterized protein LOC118204682 n=1 Tax=Stegodyphus dumicola TaxID=202533 RepID=UPI0015AB2291